MSDNSPVVSQSPAATPGPSQPPSRQGSLLHSISSTSVQTLAEVLRRSSSSSITFAEGEVEPVKAEGLRHCGVRLEARHYKKPEFIPQLLTALEKLHVPCWAPLQAAAGEVKVQKVSGSLTNAIFFVSAPAASTLLLRIYGPSSGDLISRPRELRTLHVLSSRYAIGPRVYGTFENGRVEEYFDSTTLTAADLREPQISRWIGARMAELHSVDVEAVEEPGPEGHGEGHGPGWDWDGGCAANKNFWSWLPPAKEVLALENMSQEDREAIDIERLEREWEAYVQWLATVDDAAKGSRRVFAHNDTQYGNLLRVKNFPLGQPEHRQIVVVDFEYAAPNPASFDIANHFHEWTANYHGATPHLLDPAKYPSLAERQNFYRAYLAHCPPAPTASPASPAPAPPPASVEPNTPSSPTDLAQQVADLEEQVRVWSPASHAMYAVWGLVQAREDVEGDVREPEFDYVGYARCRTELFRAEARALGAI